MVEIGKVKEVIRLFDVVNYESIERVINKRLIFECRCDVEPVPHCCLL